MDRTSRYFQVAESDDFHPSDFPLITTELTALKERIEHLRHADNGAIVISYLKDHAIQTNMVQSHAGLVHILTSKGASPYLEDLFMCSKENKRFLLSLENYLTTQLNNP